MSKHASFLSRRDFLQSTAAVLGFASALGRAQVSDVRIVGVETLALKDGDDYSYTVVRVKTDAGIDGIGQAEAPSLVIDATIRTSGGLADLLRREDPLQVERLWQKMYSQTALWGRRGVTLAAIGAVETALWDIAGKILGKPIFELIWPSFATSVYASVEFKDRVRPYATVWTPGESNQQLRERFQVAVEQGFQAVKLEHFPGGFGNGDVARDVEVVQLVRDVIGDKRELMIDVANHWPDVGMALQTCKAIDPFNVYFVEAALPADNLEAYRRLAEATDIRIAAGDWGYTTRFEFLDLMDRGGVDVVQPSTVRSGGISETAIVAEMAYRRGALCIPHSWNAMVGIAAAVHLAAVLPNMPYIEFPVAFPPSPMITELLVPTLAPDAQGWIEVPKRPGLGFSLNEEVLRRYRTEPY